MSKGRESALGESVSLGRREASGHGEQKLFIPEWIDEEWALLPSVVTTAMSATFRNFQYLQDIVDRLITAASSASSSLDQLGVELGAFRMQAAERLSALEGAQKSISFAVDELKSAVEKQAHDLRAAEDAMLGHLDAHFDRTKALINSSLSSGDFISQLFASPTLVSRLISDPAFQKYIKETVSSRLDACEQSLRVQEEKGKSHDDSSAAQAEEIAELSRRLDALKAGHQDIKSEVAGLGSVCGQVEQANSALSSLRADLDKFITETHPKAIQEVQERFFSLVSQSSRRRGGGSNPLASEEAGSLTPREAESRGAVALQEFRAFQEDVRRRFAAVNALSEQMGALDFRLHALEAFRQGEFRESLRKVAEKHDAFRTETLESQERQDVTLKELAGRGELYKESLIAKMQFLEAKMLTTLDGRDKLFAKALDLDLLSDNARELGIRIRALEAAVKRLMQRAPESASPALQVESVPPAFSARIEYTGEKSPGVRQSGGERSRPVPGSPVRIPTTPQGVSQSAARSMPRSAKPATPTGAVGTSRPDTPANSRTSLARASARSTRTAGASAAAGVGSTRSAARTPQSASRPPHLAAASEDITVSALQSPAPEGLAVRSVVLGDTGKATRTVYYDQLN